MTASGKTLHDEVAARLAREYAEAGFEVHVEPRAGDLPAFLRGANYSPDLIAVKGDEGYVVEVKLRSSEFEAERWSKIANTVQQQAGWHFRLVVVDSLTGSSFAISSREDIENGLERSRRLLEVDPPGALLVAWSVFEAAANRRLTNDGVAPVRPGPTLGLAKTLVHHGYVGQSDMKLLERLVGLRNSVAHGALSTDVTKSDVQTLIAYAAQLV